MAEPKNVVISPPNFATASVRIRGTAPFVQLRFSKKTEEILLGQQMDGQKAKNRKTREAKNPPELYEAAMYRTPDGRRGIPASAFRNAMIRACTVAGYTMTAAKMTVFIEADGYDADDGTPLVFFSKGDSHMVIHDVRNATGVIDLRVRAMWDVGWEAVVRQRGCDPAGDVDGAGWLADEGGARDAGNIHRMDAVVRGAALAGS